MRIFDTLDELFHTLHETVRVVIHKKIEVDAVPTKDLHRLTILLLIQKVLDNVKDQGPRMDYFQIPAGHLQNCSEKNTNKKNNFTLGMKKKFLIT